MDNYDASHDHYCYPGTSVLKNKLGIRSEEALEAAENEIAVFALSSIEFVPPPTI